MKLSCTHRSYVYSNNLTSFIPPSLPFPSLPSPPSINQSINQLQILCIDELATFFKIPIHILVIDLYNDSLCDNDG